MRRVLDALHNDDDAFERDDPQFVDDPVFAETIALAEARALFCGLEDRSIAARGSQPTA